MSLEQALQENTQAVNRLVALLEQQANLQVHAVNIEVQSIGAPQEAPAAADAVVEKPTVNEPETSVQATSDDVKSSLMQVAKKIGREGVQSILSKFNAPNISAIKPSDYNQVVALAERSLEEV